MDRHRQLAVPSVGVAKGRYTNMQGAFWDVMQCAPIFDEHGNLLGVTKTSGVTHLRSYGKEAPFFSALTRGRLLATMCANTGCRSFGKRYLPWMSTCPECLVDTVPYDVTTMCNECAEIYTYIVTARTGAHNTLPTPIRFVDMRTTGIATFLKGYMVGPGEPEIGMRLMPVFRTKAPTYTILDLAWVVPEVAPQDLPEGFTYALPPPPLPTSR